MDRRQKLQEILKNILGSDKVYFQPPSNTKLEYPCIIYERSDIDVTYADNIPYGTKVRYSITLIGRSPENPIVNEILKIPYCSYDRFFISDNLNHDTFSLYY
jgi:hypothetical protein